MSQPQAHVVDFHPYRWGNPDHPATLPPTAREALAAFGVDTPPAAPVDVVDVVVGDSVMPDSVRHTIESIVGEEHVTSEHDVRVAHARGWSTIDLLQLRAGDASGAPDVVVYPGSHDEVVALLEACSAENVAVVPYSGGTSVVGGLVAERDGFLAVAAIDMCRMDSLVEIDSISRIATIQAGVRGPNAEELLAEHGFTLGHFPQSFEGASIGGYAAARSSGQASAGYGRFDEMVVALTLATPRGTVQLGTAPKSAAGPDLRQLVLGSEGVFGVITSVTLRVRPKPEVCRYQGWQFEDFAAGTAALRRLAQDGPTPTVLRLSDEVETQVNMADPSKMLAGGPGGCLAIAGYEGTQAEVDARLAGASAILEAAGGQARGDEPGESWRAGRYRAPYLRDPLLDVGVLTETLETAGFWSNLPRLREAVTSAITEGLTEWATPPLVLCHISHVYETGASLYFTIACAQSEDPVAQWESAKTKANEAIRECGAAITHHHGVGTVHRDTYAREVGDLSIDVLRAIKRTVDPAGICNPGVLFTSESAG